MEIKMNLPPGMIMGLDLAKTSRDVGVISAFYGVKPERSKYEPYHKVRAFLRAVNTNNITKAIDVLVRYPWVLKYTRHYGIVANWYVNFILTCPNSSLVSMISRAQNISFTCDKVIHEDIVLWAKKYLTYEKVG